MTKREILKDILAVGIILAVLAAFFYKFLIFKMIPLNSEWLINVFNPWKALCLADAVPYFNNDTDPVLYMYPIKYVTIQMMKLGIMPLWNPYISCGAPLWGTNFSTPLNPLNLVFFIFDFRNAWAIFLMLQFAVAGIFTYLFLKEIGASRTGSIIASIAFMLNGTFVMTFETIGYLGVYCWIPLVFLLIEKVFKHRSLIYAFWCGAAMALFFTCGIIQLAAYSFAFALAYIIFKWFRSPRSVKDTLCVMAVLASVFICSLPELLMQVTNIMNSTRSPSRYGLSILYPQMLVSYLSPYFYGVKFDGWDMGFGTYIFNRGLIRLLPPYLGILSLFLAVIGFLNRKDPDRLFYLIFSAGILAILMSFALPFIYKPVLAAIPFFGAVDHYRLVTIYAFSVSVLAGLGASYLGSANVDNKAVFKTALITFSVILVLFLVLQALAFIKVDDPSALAGNIAKKMPAFMLDKAHSLKSVGSFLQYLKMVNKESGALLLSRKVYMPVGFGFLSLILIFYALYFRNSPNWKVMMIFFLAADILCYAIFFPAYSFALSVYPSAPPVNLLKSDKSLYRIVGYSEEKDALYGGILPPNTNMMYELQDVRGYENIGQPKWYYRFIRNIEPGGIVISSFNEYDNKFLKALNVKYLLSPVRLNSDKWKEVYAHETFVYKNKDVMPRVFLVKRVRFAGSEDEALKMINDRSFDPAVEAVAEGTPEYLKEIPSGTGTDYPEEITYGTNEVKIYLNGGASGLLVLSDTYFPGWKVYVDGKERKILKTNTAFRGVEIREGEREVRFIFHPRYLYLSLYICIALFLSMLFITIYVRLRKI